MRLALALTALVAAFALASCSSGDQARRGDARKGGSITVALPRDPGQLDPAAATSPLAFRALWLAYTPPLTYARSADADGTKLVPGLAEALPEASEDRRAFAFTLRRGLRYSDGSPLRPGDFEHAIKRALRLSPLGAKLFGNVEGARAYARTLVPETADLTGVRADPRTRRVEVRLVRPDPRFAYVLASPVAAPVPSATPTTESPARPPPGIGPYRLSGPRSGAAFVLSRARGFDLPGVPEGNVDEISGEVSDPAAATRAAIDGFVDVVEGEPPVELLPQLRAEHSDRYAEYPTLTLQYVAMDATRQPFADENLRRALSFALDTDALGRLQDGFLEPTCRIVPPRVVGYEPPDPCAYGERQGNSDLVRARTLVEEAPPPLPPVLVDGGRTGRDAALARYLAATLRKVGVRARPARGPAERARAQVAFSRRAPAVPLPGGYLDVVEDEQLRDRLEVLERRDDAAQIAADWASLDQDAVEAATVAPYGIETTGVLLSERMDKENCSLFHPVFGLDWSSLCLR